MKNHPGAKYYSELEEKINVWSHGFGLLLSIIALVLLQIKASNFQNFWQFYSFTVFGLSLIAVYAASTFYHNSTSPYRRRQLRIIDHAAIYLLIAGTYTPFTLITLRNDGGWSIFYTVWTIAAVGIVFKLFFTGKYDLLSTIAYILMGWVIVFDFDGLLNNLSGLGLMWLGLGGLAYMFGAVIYSIPKIKFNHAIWHFFVLAGSFCHFMSIFLYV